LEKAPIAFEASALRLFGTALAKALSRVEKRKEKCMARIVDCLVSYFGLEDNGQPGYRRYFCYHVIGGPGPTEEAGVATITTLAVYSEEERCTFCQTFHAVERGGPSAAVARAVRYLDDVHCEMNVWKVQTEGRRPAEVRMAGVLVPVPHAELAPAPLK
jgi:hypothetical protein